MCVAPPYRERVHRRWLLRKRSVAATFRSSNKPTIPIMAQSISQAKRALAFALNRRGYAVASDVSSFTSAARGGMSGIEKGVAKSGSGPSGASSAWAPDPVTGYYRPINQRDEIDPVELRKMLLNHKGKSS